MLSVDETIAKEKASAEKLRKIIETGYDGEISIEALFCDDTDAIKEAYERVENDAKECEQLAEWLEELKKRRSEDYGYMADIHRSIGYRQAIDDFVDHIRTYYTLKQEMGYVATTYKDLINYIFELAEQLKEGGENE